jgi:hypothetical protein
VIQDSDTNRQAVLDILDSFIVRHSIDIDKTTSDSLPKDLSKGSCSLNINSPKDNDYIAIPEGKNVHSDLETALITISTLRNDDKSTTQHWYNRTCLDLSRMRLMQLNLGACDFLRRKIKSPCLDKQSAELVLLASALFSI